MKFIFLTLLFVVLFSRTGLPESYVPKDKINGSGLKIPRVVSLKNSLTYMRSGPGKKYPVIFFTAPTTSVKILEALLLQRQGPPGP